MKRTILVALVSVMFGLLSLAGCAEKKNCKCNQGCGCGQTTTAKEAPPAK